MTAEIPANNNNPFSKSFSFDQVQAKTQSAFKGFGIEELCTAMQGFMQKISIPNISTIIQLPSILAGKIISLFGGKGGGQGRG